MDPHSKNSPPDSDDGLEELESEAILAQETGAHAPQPRAKVEVDQPTVVIADDAHVPSPRRRRGSNDKTLVIRDRRAVDEVRRKIALDQKRRERKRKLRVGLLWTLGGILAFGLGSVLAWYSGDDAPLPAASEQAALPAPPAQTASAALPRASAQPAVPGSGVEPPSAGVLDLDDEAQHTAAPASGAQGSTGKPSIDGAPAVNLEELPVEDSGKPAPSHARRSKSKAAPKPAANVLPF